MKKFTITGEVILGGFLIVAAATILHNQLTGEDDHLAKTDAILILASLLVGTTGIERILGAFAIHRHLQGIEDSTTKAVIPTLESIDTRGREILSHIQALELAEVLMGPDEIEDAATNLIAHCDLDDRIRASAQFVFRGGLSDKYYESLAGRLAQALNATASLSYHLIVAETSKKESLERRMPYFDKHKVKNRVKVRTIEASQPFDIVLVGDRMILALSGHNEERYNLGFLIRHTGSVKVANKWFEDVLWDHAEHYYPSPETEVRS